MDVETPPKRMTRARAAAKAGTSSATTSTIASAARTTKAAVATTTRTAASMKRKTRPDDTENDHENDEESHKPAAPPAAEAVKPTRGRGRPRKVVEPEPQPAAPAETAASAPKPTRGRAKKTAEEPPKPEPSKPTRTRAKKTQTDEDKAAAAPVPVKKTARGRAASGAAKQPGVICTEATTEPTPGLRSAVSRPASRIGAVKKSVTFQEPEKENMVPPANTKAKAKTEPATGLRAKPVRKTATAARATRASARTAPTADKKDKPTPLSPKKDGQNRPLSRASNSDDELATYEMTPYKPLMKSPVKPPNPRKLEASAPVVHDTADDFADHDDQADELAGSSIFGSPVRRPPPSPFKDSMKSPAKRAEGVPTLLFSSKKSESEATQNPLKASILQSPAKRPQVPIMALQAPSSSHNSEQPRSPSKLSFLQSPAKRPMSPFKVLGSVSRSSEKETSTSEEHAKTPAEAEPAAFQPIAPEQDPEPLAEPVADENCDNDIEMSQSDDEDLESPAQLEFPGRLSAVLPRHADPALQDKPSPTKALSTEQLQPVEVDEAVSAPEPVAVEAAHGDPMEVDGASAEEPMPSSPPTKHTPQPAVQAANPMFGLRQKDLVPQDIYDSEDELALSGKSVPKFREDTTLSFSGVPATPTPGSSRTSRNALPSSAIKNAGRAIRSVSRGPKLGFTPLARQLGDWRASSPSKTEGDEAMTADAEEYSLLENDIPATADRSPSKGTFFEDEMKIRAEMELDLEADAEAEMMAALEADLAANYEDPVFDDVPITSEDVELAAEADEMSLLEPNQAEAVFEVQAHDDSISEASQEYGDENAMPIDPALLGPAGQPVVPPVTPMRPSTMRTFNTTTKVPLKPADDSTPMTLKKRSASVSRAPMKRPAGPSRNATVISYSPEKESSKTIMEEDEQQQPPVTPAKSDIWSSIGTPARTPRRDVNPSLLRGAVVFVDVHTSEGADASPVFVELLSQMGARCVKSWTWNPTTPANGDLSTAKVGITHVVYKDGGKRTMEKVRETGGVVQCVGVGWVLDCERENEWLDEAQYYIDTSLVPRGGARRRKSMEPRALANMNGTLVTPMKQTAAPARDCQTVPNNHVSRRDSTAWVRSPSNPDDDEEMGYADEDQWDGSMLTPVPKTPAPEAIHRYVTEMDVTPETPSADWSQDNTPEQQQMLTRTAPPKPSIYADLGSGVLSPQKDQNVMMRLMAARRKSLQFAPKIASPLSKAWN
ncbi:hypothetical protein JX266_001321 [Neoarthrinium moseri]|nr:hypothetical protein JX266_001321 [Neoarthrinium moseri]